MTAPAMFAFGSSLGWGVSDFLGGVASRRLRTRSVLLLSQTVSLVLLAGAVAILGSQWPPLPGPVLAAVLAGLGEIVGVAALYRGLSVGVTGIVSPASSAAPALPLAFSVVAGDLPSPVRGIGLVLVVAGVVLTAVQPGVPGGGNIRASVTYGLLSAAGFGIYYVAMDTASDAGVPWALLVARTTAVLTVLASFAVVRYRPDVHRTDLAPLALIGALVAAADAMYAVAATLGDLSLVATLAAFHPVVTVGLARIRLHERLGRTRRLGVATSVAGIMAITAT